MTPATDPTALLRLLQLASPTLPIGAYSYSEGLETLAATGQLNNATELQGWLIQQLQYGTIRIDGAVLLRARAAAQGGDWDAVIQWNQWLSASRETAELRQSSQQMGQALLKLLGDLVTPPLPWPVAELTPCNGAIAFALAAWQWQLDSQTALLGYLQSWATNVISAGVKVIPLGQTAGQRLLWSLDPHLDQARQQISQLDDHNLNSCGWGLSLASMAHETQYSRLFRS
ncbi:urease accessory protein UreF [Spirulina major]|uniref:urease accessory protein UreF n=1 Tax=Spirulina major TaxID=270636 RepID=UPI000933FE6A|nr:urease accessory protein UreF [Spirulina major]